MADAPAAMDSRQSPKWSEGVRPRNLLRSVGPGKNATGLLASGLIVSLCVLLQYFMRRAAFPNPPPDFCALTDGSFLYTDVGEGGRDLYVFDVRSRTGRRVARTPYRESEPAVSPDGKTAVCAYRSSMNTGLLLIDLVRGTTRKVTQNESARDVFPVFSPTGRRIAFARTPGVSWQSNAARELWEVDLQTGKQVRININPYHAVWSPAYRDENHLFFTGDVVSGPSGAGKRVVTEFSRKENKARMRPLPNTAALRIFGFSTDGKRFYALASRKPQQDSNITWGEIDTIASPGSWVLSGLRTSDAALMPSRREMLYLSQNDKYYFICCYTLSNGKSQALMKLPK
jgi:hypothetical protein